MVDESPENVYGNAFMHQARHQPSLAELCIWSYKILRFIDLTKELMMYYTKSMHSNSLQHVCFHTRFSKGDITSTSKACAVLPSKLISGVQAFRI